VAAQGERADVSETRCAPALAAMVERFGHAQAHAGGRDLDLVVAGRHVRLRFAGEALDHAIVPALAHLVATPSASGASPALVMHVWDTRSTGVDMIAAPWDTRALGPGGSIPEAEAEGLYVIYRLECDMLVALDVRAGVGVLWMHDAALYPRHDRAAPLRSTFAAFFAPRGPVVTHAAAIGRGGSGKSTTSLLCLAAGLDFAGDDYVLVEVDDDARAPGPPRVHSLYATSKLAPRDVARVPALVDAFAERDDSERAASDKAVAFLHGHPAARLTRGLELVALLLPSVTGAAETTLAPMSRAEALRGLAPSTVFQQDVPARPVLATLARLVARLPCYRLALGADLAAIPDVIARVIDGAPP